ncbi:MAG TPA: hypothetical protein VKR59_11465 [Terriglobales bacterium]|nr:hypothetical protein [Terriglobales bacterium]
MKSLRSTISPRTISHLAVTVLAVACVIGAFAQSPSDDADTVHGVVINSVTHEPISRALVSSPDNRFATLTNNEGRFEFALHKVDTSAVNDPNGPVGNDPASIGTTIIDGPNHLTAHKPGFQSDPNDNWHDVQSNRGKDLTLQLVPEGLIVGTVSLATSEAPDSMTLQIYRRQIQEGTAHWFPAGGTQSNSEGQFRFADLPAGTYKILTRELLDRDPLTADPQNFDPITNEVRGPLFGYPPAYYQNASDFESATPIQLLPGQTSVVSLSVTRQPYYRVKVAAIDPAPGGAENGLQVNVYANGHKGPGFTLGYNNAHHTIEGSLPNGTYTVEASSFGPDGMSGSQTITVKGSPVQSASLTLAPNSVIPVTVKEEFTGNNFNGTSSFGSNGRNVTFTKGPRVYLRVFLEPIDELGMGTPFTLRNPTGSADDSLMIEGARAGRYWVRIRSLRGYAASVRSGNLDLLHQPLVVGEGGATSPIEITMRDDLAEISGTIEGMNEGMTAPGPAGGPAGSTGSTPASASPQPSAQSAAHVYCIPLADSPGQFTEMWVGSDGSFVSQNVAPGAYRLLAFDHEQSDIEYRNPEAMQNYDSKGIVVRVSGGQKERVQLHLISSGGSAGAQ